LEESIMATNFPRLRAASKPRPGRQYRPVQAVLSFAASCPAVAGKRLNHRSTSSTGHRDLFVGLWRRARHRRPHASIGKGFPSAASTPSTTSELI